MRFIFGLSLLFMFTLPTSQYNAMDQRWMKIFRDGNETYSPLLAATVINNHNGTLMKRSKIAPSTTPTSTILKSTTLKPTAPILTILEPATMKPTSQKPTILKPATMKPTTLKPTIQKPATPKPKILKRNPYSTYERSHKKLILKKSINNGTTRNETTYTIPTLNEITTNPTLSVVYTTSTHNETIIRPTHDGITYTRPMQNGINETTYKIPTHDRKTYTRPIHNEINGFTLKVPTQNKTTYTIPTHNGTTYTRPIQRTGTTHKIPTYKKQPCQKLTCNGITFKVPGYDTVAYKKPTVKRHAVRSPIVFMRPVFNDKKLLGFL